MTDLVDGYPEDMRSEIDRLRADNERLQAALQDEATYDKKARADNERLRKEGTVELAKALLEIERLRDELDTWKSCFEAERQDHEATIKAWNEERSGL